jgi:hypothetical protein
MLQQVPPLLTQKFYLSMIEKKFKFFPNPSTGNVKKIEQEIQNYQRP